MTKEEKRLYQEGFKDGFEAAKQEFKKVEYIPYIPWHPYYPYYNYDKWTITTTPYVDSHTTVVTGQHTDTPNGTTETKTTPYSITYTT